MLFRLADCGFCDLVCCRLAWLVVVGGVDWCLALVDDCGIAIVGG